MQFSAEIAEKSKTLPYLSVFITFFTRSTPNPVIQRYRLQNFFGALQSITKMPPYKPSNLPEITMESNLAENMVAFPQPLSPEAALVRKALEELSLIHI